MMIEILITSTVLILALLLIRRIFRDSLSRRVQYGLWGLVLLRLLVPVNLLPAADFSILTAVEPVEQTVVERVNRQVYYSRPVEVMTPEVLEQRDIRPSDVPTVEEGAVMVLSESDQGAGWGQTEGYLVRDPETDSVTLYEHMAVGPWEILAIIWKAGMVLMAGVFVVSNLGVYFRLRKHRREWADDIRPYGGKRKVYLVAEGVIPSPCLFGRSVYITEAVARDPARLGHVLCHEETHARHLDPLWAFLRCVCLAVYWFDPFVWIAAGCSKTDCELACDEGALAVLGEEERLPYGRTLVSLIPVRRGPSNPLVAATTMTAGKKQLKDRVSRIAGGSRQMAAAVLAVAVLAGAISACTFTGGKPAETVSPAPVESRVLSGEELKWFNEEFFNVSVPAAVSYTYNICNQFANGSFNLYDRPEDIDLYELLYCEGTVLTEEEYTRVFGGEEMPCPAYKISPAEIDAILMEYTGITLAQSNQVGMENFTYKESDDAYYWMHGDTNYPGEIEILCGTREGNIVRLYHSGGGYCVTLEEQGDGSYWFRSNQECEKPNLPTPLPDWEPTAVVSLKDLEPYVAPAVTVENRAGDDKGNYENWLEHCWVSEEDILWVYRSTQDGRVYAGLEREDGSLDGFFSSDDPNCETRFFSLLGQTVLAIGHLEPSSETGVPLWDFYSFQDGAPVLLAQSRSGGGVAPQTLDLDGDGREELVTNGELFFEREGLLCRADLRELVERACPGLGDWSYVSWDRYGKYFSVHGYTEGYKEWTRLLYFDGESLLIYRNEKPTVDHVVAGADEKVPAPVVEAAREFVEGVYDRAEKERREADPVYDDWRVDYFNGPYTYSYGGVTVEGWWLNYETHTTTPEDVVLAGGRYITEEDWVSPGYPGCDALFFEVRDGAYRLIHSGMYQEGPRSYYIEEQVLRMMEEAGVELSEEGCTYAGLWFQKRLEYLTDPAVAGDEMRIQYEDGLGQGGTYAMDPQTGNGPYYLKGLCDFSQVEWSRTEGPETEPGGPVVTFSNPDWDGVLRFWENGLVMFKAGNQEPEWYTAQAREGVRALPYAYYGAKGWFDEMERLHLEIEEMEREEDVIRGELERLEGELELKVKKLDQPF